MSPTRGQGFRFRAPPSHTRTSELLLPASTGRSCTRATLRPSRAADNAAQVPAMPPPTTTRSNFPPSRASRTARAACGGRPSARGSLLGGGEPSSEKTMASQRPSKPLRSCRATFACRAEIFTLPPGCQCHCGPFDAEGGRQRLAVDQHLEPARLAGGVPRRNPVAGADPQAVGPRRGKRGGRASRRGPACPAHGPEGTASPSGP